MTAAIYRIRDYHSPKDIERMRRMLEVEAAAILAEVVPFGGKGIDGMWPNYVPDKEPA